MNWLLISSENIDNENLKQIINERTPDSVIYESSFVSSELDEVLEVLPEITNCVIKHSEDSEPNENLFFLLGYLAGKDIPVYTNNLHLYENFSKFDCISYFKTIEEIEQNIEEHYEDLYTNFLRKQSYNYLMEQGMPFTPDSFALNISQENKDICECYLAAGMDVNCRDKDGTPMLNIAARNDKVELIHWLIDNGADINAVSEDRGYTAIMDAVWRGDKEITELLINKGAELNTVCKEGQTMLVLAVGANKIEICKLLAEAGADPDIKDSMGMSAYGYAKLFKKQEIIDVLEKYHKE